MTNYNVNKVFKRVCEKIYEDRDVVKVLERKEKREDHFDRIERRSVSFLILRKEEAEEDSSLVVALARKVGLSEQIRAKGGR